MVIVFVNRLVFASGFLNHFKNINLILKKHKAEVFAFSNKVKPEPVKKVYNTNPFMALKFEKANKGDIYKNDNLVVGYSNPDEQVDLSGNCVIKGDIIVVNNGRLNFDNANIILYGNILVADNGILRISNSSLNILSKFVYSNYMMVYGSGKVEFNSTTINLNGFNFICALLNRANLEIKDTTFDACITTGIRDNASAIVDNSNPFEWVVQDSGKLTIKNSPGAFILWPVFGENAKVDTSFPEGSHIDYFSIKDGENGFENIPINVSIENSDNILWGMMVEKGADVTIRNSSMTSTAIVSTSQDFFELNGIVNNQYFYNRTLSIDGINLRYINSSVRIFNFYQRDTDSVEIKNSILGEIGVEGGQQCEISNTIVDGSGGYFYTEGETTTTFIQGGLYSHTVAAQNSLQVFIYSTIQNGDIIAKDNSAILLANTLHNTTPQALNSGFIIDALINIPVSESVNSIIPVKGTAYLYYGEQSPVRFSSYSLSYATSENPDNWIPIVQSEETPIENGILGFWNTSGLEPGNYTLKLTLNVNMGDPIEITKNIFLGVEGTGRQTFLIPHIDNGDYWESYLVFDNLTGFYKKAEVFLNKEGRFYKKIDVDLTPYEQKRVSLEGDSGFIRCDLGLSAREFFVSKTEGGIAEFNLSAISGENINFLMPLYSADILNWEGVAFQNTENLASNVSLKAYSPDGSVIGEKDFELNPLGKSAGVVNTYFQDIDYSSLGRIEANADTLLNGVVISGNGNLNLLFTHGVSIPDAGKYLIPHIANEWDTWQNILVFDNLTEQAKTIKLTLFSQGEKVVDSKDYQIPPYGQVTLNLNGFKSLSPDCGYAKTESGVAVRQGFKSAQGGIAEFLLSSDTSYNLVLNMPQTENDKLNWNGIALMNPNDGDANVTLNAYRSGNLIETTQIVILANRRVVGILSDFFSNLGDNAIDRVEVISDRPLTGLTISGLNQQLLLFASPCSY